ncbi:DoxX family protein, partial [Halolamina salina]
PATAVAAVSLPVTVLYLAVVAATDGRFVDVLIRDVGLAALAWVVLLDALGAE